MKYGLVFANFGERSAPRTLADLAHLAEGAGWDGVFLSDALQMVGAEEVDHSDPWIGLSANNVEPSPPASGNEAYIAKYREGLKSYGATPEEFAADYVQLIRVELTGLRGY
jgi:hypothetical protein